MMRFTLVLALLVTLTGISTGENQYKNDARMGGQTKSTEALLEEARGPKKGIRTESDTLVGRAFGQAAAGMKQNLPTGGNVTAQASGYWNRFTKWSGEKWTALKDWWNSPSR